MREILFRGKSCRDGEWTYGNLRIRKSELSGPYDKYFIERETEQSLISVIEVDPDTVGQYTGLKDKYGKKIFEGDLLRYYTHYTKRRPMWIEWRSKEGRFVGVGHGCFLGGETFKEWHIIGNIYDNPELMEDKEND